MPAISIVAPASLAFLAGRSLTDENRWWIIADPREMAVTVKFTCPARSGEKLPYLGLGQNLDL